jgi:transposase
MGGKLEITRSDYASAALRALSGRCTDGAQVRRLLALALVLDGYSRPEAATLNGMDRQTLRDWVHRYNAEGVEGLKSRSSPGRAPALSEAQMAELRELVIQGSLAIKCRLDGHRRRARRSRKGAGLPNCIVR